jgi:hypothetical protein
VAGWSAYRVFTNAKSAQVTFAVGLAKKMINGRGRNCTVIVRNGSTKVHNVNQVLAGKFARLLFIDELGLMAHCCVVILQVLFDPYQETQGSSTH